MPEHLRGFTTRRYITSNFTVRLIVLYTGAPNRGIPYQSQSLLRQVAEIVNRRSAVTLAGPVLKLATAEVLFVGL